MGSGTEAAPKMPAGAHRATISSWELCPTSQPRHQGLGTPRRDTGTPGPKVGPCSPGESLLQHLEHLLPLSLNPCFNPFLPEGKKKLEPNYG